VLSADAFRALALAIPGALESAHMGRPDFRIGGKIFATLQPAHNRAMVKLAPEQQALLAEAEKSVFTPVPGAWGRQGATYVELVSADAATAQSALEMAAQNLAHKNLTPRRR
jgi:hypothetical protein